MNAAGWMALPVGAMWSASFLCTMYGYGRPMLSLLGTVIGISSIYVLYRQLRNYRRLFPSVRWLYILRLSLVTCLLAGLLTDAVQSLYFTFLDNGHLLSMLNNAFQSEEYRDVWQKIMPDTKLEDVQKMIQSMTVRDFMLQIGLYNVVLALPVSLIAAIAVKAVKVPK